MNKRTFDKKFFEFPICVLIYCKTDREKLLELISYCLVEMAICVDAEFEKLDLRNYKLPIDFKENKEFHIKIICVAYDYGLEFQSIKTTVIQWQRMKMFTVSFQAKYGKDAICRIGKQLLIETIKGIFDLKELLVLCAIQSVIGKKKIYARITYERIAYCMMGYRKRDISITENMYQQRLSDRQVAICVSKLHNKRLITTITYFREKYYSTRIKTDERLQEIIAHKKYKYAEKKKNVTNKEWARNVKREIERIKNTSTYNRYFLDGTLTA